MRHLYLQKKFNKRLKRGASIISFLIIAFSVLIFLVKAIMNGVDLNYLDWVYVSTTFLITTLVSRRYGFIGGIVLFFVVIVIDILFVLGVFDDSVGLYFSLFLIPACMFIVASFLDRVQADAEGEFTKMKHDYERLEQNYSITREMMGITPEMLVDDNLDVLLDNIIKKAVKVIPKAQAGSILILNKERMEFRAAAGYDLNLLKKVNLGIKDIFQHKLGIFHEPVIIKNLEAFHESNLGEEATKRLRTQEQLTAKSIISCAIYFKNKIYGSINLDNLEDLDAFGEEDKKYIQHLATHIEIALKNQVLIENIYKLSRFDVLTNVYTRKYHEELLEKTFRQAKQHKELFSICTIDINNLKKINDKHGHAEGDKYLIHFCSIIKKATKAEAILSRTGGDEFTIIYHGDNCEDATKKIKNLRNTISRKPFSVEGCQYNIDFGCGIACFPDDGIDLEKLIGLSDQRMYEDKRRMKTRD